MKTCQVCGKDLIGRESKYCREHANEAMRKIANERKRSRYHNDEEYRKYKIDITYKQRLRRMLEPEYRERYLEYMKQWARNHRENYGKSREKRKEYQGINEQITGKRDDVSELYIEMCSICTELEQQIIMTFVRNMFDLKATAESIGRSEEEMNYILDEARNKIISRVGEDYWKK